jgi:hypothetical protein
LSIYSKGRRDRLLSAAFMLVLVLLAVPVFSAQAQEEAGEAASLSLQAYAPARIVITYAYTNNFSVSDVSAMGRPEYKIISGPTSIEFKTEDTDRFTFTVEIKYAAVVGQSIQIALFSAGNPPEGIQLNVKTSTVRIRITLTVTEEPRYPSAQDVAEQVVRQVANQLMMFRHQTDETLEMQSRNIEVQWMILAFNTSVSVGLVMFIVHWVWPLMKRLRAEEAEAAASTFTEEESS